MSDSDRQTETSSIYCATEFPTAKKKHERLITTTTDMTKQAFDSPAFDEPEVIKQAKEEILEQLEYAMEQFARLQKQMWDEQREHDQLFQEDALKISEAQQQVEAERTILDQHMLLSADLEEEKRQLDLQEQKQKLELE